MAEKGSHLAPYHFKPGQSGNPGGRSKASKELARIVQEQLEGDGDEHQGVKLLWEIAVAAERDGDRIRALEILFAYGYGKPRQSMDVDVRTEVAEMPSDEVMIQAFWIIRENLGEAEFRRLLGAPPTGAVIDAELDGASDGVEGSRRGPEGPRPKRKRSGKKRGSDE